MFFVFSKLFFFAINPINWVIALLILSFVFRKKNKLVIVFLISSLSIAYIFSNKGLYNYFAMKWEVQSLPTTSVQAKYRYGIVLGGMASKNKETGKLHISQSIDRILTAITLYNEGKIEKIVITGGSGMLLDRDVKEANDLFDYCKSFNVPDSSIIIESESRNTYENAVFTKQKIGLPNQKVLLITSALHMPRSKAIFEKQGFRLDYISTDPTTATELYFDDYIIPNSEILSRWNYLNKEMIGYWVYKLQGYL